MIYNNFGWVDDPSHLYSCGIVLVIMIRKRKRRVYKQIRFLKKKLIREVSLGICNGYKHKPISVNVSKNGLRLESDSMESVVSVMEETNVYVILYIY